MVRVRIAMQLLRPSPGIFCICIPYEERKEKKEALQKEEVSSNHLQPHAHPAAVVIPARRGRASSSSPPQDSFVTPRLRLFLFHLRIEGRALSTTSNSIRSRRGGRGSLFNL
jgi:hypothetical protein